MAFSDLERRVLFEIGIVVAVAVGVLAALLVILTGLGLGAIIVIAAVAWLAGSATALLLAS